MFVDNELWLIDWLSLLLFPPPWHAPFLLPFPMVIMSGLRCRTLRVTSYSTFVTLITSCPEVQCPFAMQPETGFLLPDPYLSVASHILVTVSNCSCINIFLKTWTMIRYRTYAYSFPCWSYVIGIYQSMFIHCDFLS